MGKFVLTSSPRKALVGAQPAVLVLVLPSLIYQ